MISILIPVYNFSIGKMVSTLLKQCQKLDIEFEILCFDDGSSAKFKAKNEFLSGAFGVNYIELKENLGRSKIRNWLAKSARFENLLFLDCDSKIIKKDFIKTYLEHASKADIISGGRIYNKKPPRAKSKLLHWKYGVKRESKSAKLRNEYKVRFFHSNNFLVKRECISKVKFDEHFEGYGYEDLYFAQDVLNKGYTIHHIDNPVEHLGLEKAIVFLKKTENAVKSLAKMTKQRKTVDTQIQSWHFKLKNWNLDQYVMNWLQKNEEKLKANLLGTKPSIFKLNLYKLLLYNRAL